MSETYKPAISRRFYLVGVALALRLVAVAKWGRGSRYRSGPGCRRPYLVRYDVLLPYSPASRSAVGRSEPWSPPWLLSILGGGGKGCVAYLCVLLPGLAQPAHIPSAPLVWVLRPAHAPPRPAGLGRAPNVHPPVSRPPRSARRWSSRSSLTVSPRCTLGTSWRRPLRLPTYTVTGTAAQPPLPT